MTSENRITRVEGSHLAKTSGVARTSFVNELTLMMSVNSSVFGNYMRSIIIMEAEAEATKARINFISRKSRWQLIQEIDQHKKG